MPTIELLVSMIAEPPVVVSPLFMNIVDAEQNTTVSRPLSILLSKPKGVDTADPVIACSNQRVKLDFVRSQIVPHGGFDGLTRYQCDYNVSIAIGSRPDVEATSFAAIEVSFMGQVYSVPIDISYRYHPLINGPTRILLNGAETSIVRIWSRNSEPFQIQKVEASSEGIVVENKETGTGLSHEASIHRDAIHSAVSALEKIQIKVFISVPPDIEPYEIEALSLP